MKKSWLIWVGILIFLAYTPFLRNLGVFSNGISPVLGIWVVLTALSLLTVLAFAVSTWGEWE